MLPSPVVPAWHVAGTWVVDPTHSELSFTIRHLGLFKIRGSFTTFRATINVPPDQAEPTVEAVVDMTSVDTREPNRDTHLRSPDFFDVERYPHMTFQSTGVRIDGEDAVLRGDLTIRDATRPFELAVTSDGVVKDPMGHLRAGFVAHGELSRSDFGITFNMPFGESGVVISDKVQVKLEIQAVHQENEPVGDTST